MRDKKVWVFPVVLFLMVLTLGGGLLAIFARSPYTHTNLATQPLVSFARTQQTLVGSDTAYTPPGPAQGGTVNAADLMSDKSIFVAEKCASCHGLNGQGGVFAPPIVGFGLDKLIQKTQEGPGGMPTFKDLSNTDIAAIKEYLDSGMNLAQAK